jgi:hypothetical protein
MVSTIGQGGEMKDYWFLIIAILYFIAGFLVGKAWEKSSKEER